MKIISLVFFALKKLLGLKIFWDKKKFGVRKYFGVRIIFDKKNFRVSFGVRKNEGLKILVIKKFEVRQNFGVFKFWDFLI